MTIDDSDDPKGPAASEFYIGTGGTYAVPAGATTLYLGLHDVATGATIREWSVRSCRGMLAARAITPSPQRRVLILLLRQAA